MWARGLGDSDKHTENKAFSPCSAVLQLIQAMHFDQEDKQSISSVKHCPVHNRISYQTGISTGDGWDVPQRGP